MYVHTITFITNTCTYKYFQSLKQVLQEIINFKWLEKKAYPTATATIGWGGFVMDFL